jgi:hypothetical protein
MQMSESTAVPVCANMHGPKKMPLLVVGKTKKLRCFEHVRPLSCTYRHNTSEWITCALFMEFLTCLERMAGKNLKILMFLDQCAEYAKDTSKLRHMQVKYLPANPTTVLQIMHKGRIISSRKYKYNRCLVCKFLQSITTTIECYKLSLSDIISITFHMPSSNSSLSQHSNIERKFLPSCNVITKATNSSKTYYCT